MEPIHEQVTTLTQKVDALHLLIDQINARISDILARSQFEDGMTGHGPHAVPLTHSNSAILSDSGQIHKDVLMDSTYITPDRSGAEKSLSPEVQIQRLTAQLTAAYNRIAALEEQLLASRVL
ncbi:MAG: hypothetical protein O3C67_12680 [Cyanobacteria bacterium]|nr:hypothetical protein [Cyanobacteriota bacterium]